MANKEKLKAYNPNKSTMSEKKQYVINRANEKKKRLWEAMNPGKKYPG
tara:strand:+ start:364 stop:507 length:144 start_codon:yes stop_codon:yes gene_type:complete